jgi:hypothetical protein
MYRQNKLYLLSNYAYCDLGGYFPMPFSGIIWGTLFSIPLWIFIIAFTKLMIELDWHHLALSLIKPYLGLMKILLQFLS